MSTTPEPVVLVEKHPQGYAVVTLNRPAAMNALSKQLRATLADTIDALEADPDVRVLILTGAGKAFTAGLDLKELGGAGGGAAGLGSTNDAVRTQDPVQSLARFSGPVIGAINGVAITGGFELALACDVLLASTQARFADTHARVGVMPGWGLSQKLARMIGISRAKELSLSGNFLDARTACEWGLLNRVVPADDLLSAAKKLASDIASADPGMVQAYKALIDEGFALSFGEGMALENSKSSAANSQVDKAEVEARRLAVMERGRTQQG